MHITSWDDELKKPPTQSKCKMCLLFVGGTGAGVWSAPAARMFHKSRSGEPLSSPPPRLRNQLLGPLLVPPQLVEHPRELGLLVRGGRGDGSGAARRRQLRRRGRHRGRSLLRGTLLGLGAGSTLALSHLGLVRGEFRFRFVIKLKVIYM